MNDQRINEHARTTAPPIDNPVSLPNEPYYQQPVAPKRNPKAVLGMVLVLIGLFWLGLQVSGGNGLFGFGRGGLLYDETLTGSRLELNVGSGDVRIRSWNSDGIHIKAIQEGGSRDAYQVDVSQTGDTVRVTHNEQNSFCFFCDNSIRYEIDLPVDMAASIETTSGEIRTDGTAGEITINSLSGDIEANNSSNTMQIDTASGSVALEHANGAVTVKTISGDIELEHASGTLSLESASGEIRVRDGRDAQFNASTISGDIEYSGDLRSAENSSVTTASGEVQMKLPEDSALRIDATTMAGEINSDFELNNAANDTGLKIETTSGDIRVERD